MSRASEKPQIGCLRATTKPESFKPAMVERREITCSFCYLVERVPKNLIICSAGSMDTFKRYGVSSSTNLCAVWP